MRNKVLRGFIVINFENMIEFELFDPVFNFQHTQLLKFFSTNVGPGLKFQYETNDQDNLFILMFIYFCKWIVTK